MTALTPEYDQDESQMNCVRLLREVRKSEKDGEIWVQIEADVGAIGGADRWPTHLAEKFESRNSGSLPCLGQQTEERSVE